MRARRAFPILVVAALLASPTLAVAATAPQPLVSQGVETSGYPRMSVRVLIPPELQDAGTPVFMVSENGRPLKTTAEPAPGGHAPLAVVLVIDTSGSMKGTPLVEAKRAASIFLQALRPEDEVALVGFNDRPRVVLRFSTDRAAAGRAVTGLVAGGETALNDAVLAGEALAAGSRREDRSVVMLSDGGDTNSVATRAAMLAAVGRSGIPVFAVGLRSPEADPAVLAQIASQSRGRAFDIADAAGLSATYGSVAREIQNAYDVTFVSARPNTKDLELDVAVRAGSKRRSVSMSVANPSFLMTVPITGTGVQVTPMTLGILGILGVSVVVFFATAMLVFALLAFLTRESTTLDQVRYYSTPIGGPGSATPAPPGTVTARMMEAVGSVTARRGLTAEVESRLARAGLPLRPVEYIVLHVATVCATGMVVQLIVGSFPVAVAAVVLMTVLPFAMLDMLARRRQDAFRAQLPQVLNLLAGSLRAGYGLLQGVELIVGEMSEPASVEFARVVTEARLGLPVESALEKMADRMGSDDFRWAVTAIGIQREVGGNLAEVLDVVATTVRERDGLRRHISGLTAEGRLSATILAILPFAVVALMLLVVPDYIGALFANPVGTAIVGFAIVLLGVGLLWLRHIVRIEV